MPAADPSASFGICHFQCYFEKKRHTRSIFERNLLHVIWVGALGDLYAISISDNNVEHGIWGMDFYLWVTKYSYT